MAAATIDANWQATYEELFRLYYAYRVAWLNTMYHGHLYETVRRWIKVLRGTSAVAASATIGGLVSNLPPDWKWLWISLVALAAISSALQPFLGLDQKLLQYDRAKYSHSLLYAKFEDLIRQIRRSGYMTEEQQGVAKALLAMHSSLAALDPPKVSKRLTRKYTADMERMFPTDEHAWDRF